MDKNLVLQPLWGRPKRPPLRSFKEMCVRCGTTQARMGGLLSTRNGPAAALITKSQRSEHWYNPKEFMAWFNKLPKDKINPD